MASSTRTDTSTEEGRRAEKAHKIATIAREHGIEADTAELLDTTGRQALTDLTNLAYGLERRAEDRSRQAFRHPSPTTWAEVVDNLRRWELER